MGTTVWGRVLLGLCALALLLMPVNLWMAAGSFGFPQFAGLSVTSVTPVGFKIAVKRNGPAYRLGLRTGDVVDEQLPFPADRYRSSAGPAWPTGSTLTAKVRHGNDIRLVSIPIEKTSRLSWDVVFYYAGALWLVLFSALVTWRRPDSAEARTLALILLLWVLGSAFARNDWITRWAVLDTVAGGLSSILFAAGAALFATYAMLFARPPWLLRRVLSWASYISAGVFAAYDIGLMIAVWAGHVDSHTLRVLLAGGIVGNWTDLALWLLTLLFPLLCVFVTVAQARGAERARISWATASLGFLYVVFLLSGAVTAFDVGFGRFSVYLQNVAIFIAPIGLTYSLLNRRHLDVGFAINRAAVFSVVSLVVVGIFVIAEWLAGEWFRGAGRTTNVAISAVLALGLGFSVRAIHSRVDRVLDNVFFRKRHEDEQAIRSFAHEAGYISDPATLTERAMSTLEARADASFVQFVLADGEGRYSGVSADDPAIVALRAWGKVVDIHAVQTDLRGEFAYPMIARGRLVGALVLGPKRSGESYAPDESDAIAQLARSVGSSLDVLSANGHHSRDAVLDALAGIRTALADLRADLLADRRRV